jgi:hypothetical protein
VLSIFIFILDYNWKLTKGKNMKRARRDLALVSNTRNPSNNLLLGKPSADVFFIVSCFSFS